MFGDHAIYHDGWIASTKVMRPPWVVTAPVSKDPASFPYELYDVVHDWTQFNNVADKYPDKVKEMDKLWEEAQKYQVLPLDASTATRFVAPRPSLSAGRTTFTWSGEITGTPNGGAPSILDSSYHYTAEVDIPQGGGEGMIVTQGGRFDGYGFYMLKGKPVFLWNLFNLERARWEGPEALSPGKHALEFDFKYNGMGLGTLAYNSAAGVGQGGTGTLKVDGKCVIRKGRNSGLQNYQHASNSIRPNIAQLAEPGARKHDVDSCAHSRSTILSLSRFPWRQRSSQ